jgi:hypothetical protein
MEQAERETRLKFVAKRMLKKTPLLRRAALALTAATLHHTPAMLLATVHHTTASSTFNDLIFL